MKPIALILAPSNLGLMPLAPGREPGTRHAPEALVALGLPGALGAADVITVEAPPYDPAPGREINIRNLGAIADYSVRLADAVEAALRDGRFPFVVGGDCSILLGTMLGARRVSEPSLIFVDGHTDFYLPEQSGTGGAAGMDLALVTGWGPPALTDIEGRRPYVQISRTAVIGNRDHEPRRRAAIPNAQEAGCFYGDLRKLRDEGIGRTVRDAVAATDPGGTGYWLHVDVDVLDSELMPAVDSPQADGLSWAEFQELLAAALAGNALGMQLTIYDPDKDPERVYGRRLVQALAASMPPPPPA